MSITPLSPTLVSSCRSTFNALGFNLLELLVVLALAGLLLSLGMSAWQQNQNNVQRRSELVRVVQEVLRAGQQHARRDGVILVLRPEGSFILLETAESDFSTRWRVVLRRALPERWQLLTPDNQPLLILPHGRPADAVEWQFQVPEEPITLWLRILVSGVVEWEFAS